MVFNLYQKKINFILKNNIREETADIKEKSKFKNTMKFSDLKSLLQQEKLLQFESEIQQSDLVQADYDLLLREVIKNKLKNLQKYFNLLIKKGADVNFANIGGNKKSNLMVACEQGTLQSVQLLCSHQKIDLNIQDSMKKTAPFYAIENKNKNDGQIFLDKLLKKAPHLIHQPANNQTMLILAIKRQKPELVKILLHNRAEPNYIITDSGNTALHEALKLCKTKQTKANRQIVKLLLQHGADPNIKNKKDKNAFQFADKFQLKALVDEIQVKNKIQEKDINLIKNQHEKQNQKTKKIVLKLNTQKQINDSLLNADQICRRELRKLQITQQSPNANSKTVFNNKSSSVVQIKDQQDLMNLGQTSSDQSQNDQDSQDLCSFKKSQFIIPQLTQEIQQFSQRCQDYYHKASHQIEDFLNKVRNIAHKQGFNAELYGSFSTGLWLKHCDIDIILIPHEQYSMDRPPNWIQNTIDRFQMLLKKQPSIIVKQTMKNKKVKVPMLRFEIQFPHPHGSSRLRKFDITVLDRSHNGLAIAVYVSQNLKVFPQLKPLFYTIKSLTHHFKLHDPKNGGIRTYAIIIMILSFLQSLGISPNQFSLGQLLLRFLFFFGYEYQYGYGYENETRQQQYMQNIQPQRQATMMLTIHDPLNPMNNVGKHSKAYELQASFKAAYIGLHANIKGNKLQYIFDLKKIILPI